MRTILMTAVNAFIGVPLEDDSENVKPQSSAEVVIVTAETEYTFDPGGRPVRQQKIETIRFVTSTKMVRVLAQSLLDHADQVDEEQDGLCDGNKPPAPKKQSGGQEPPEAP